MGGASRRSLVWTPSPPPPLLPPLESGAFTHLARKAGSEQPGGCLWTHSQGAAGRELECGPLDSHPRCAVFLFSEQRLLLPSTEGGVLLHVEVQVPGPRGGSSLSDLELSSILGLHVCAFLSQLALKSTAEHCLLSLALEEAIFG